MVKIPNPFKKRKSQEEKLLEKQIEGNILVQAVAGAAATHELVREEGVSIWIVKDPDLQNILTSFGAEPIIDDDGKPTDMWKIKDTTLSSLLVLHGTIFQTGTITPHTGEYLKRTVDVILARKELSYRFNKNGEEKTRSVLEYMNMLDVLRAYFYNIIDSAVEGKRVIVLKAQTRVIRTKLEREEK